MKRRLGRFLMKRDYLARWEELLPLMGNFVVVDTRFRYDCDAIEYMAYSPLFEEIADGMEAPEYDVVVTLNEFAPATINVKRL